MPEAAPMTPTPPVIQIDDPADPRVAAYVDIRERDLVGRKGLFVAEGEVVLRVLIGGARYAPASLLIAEKRMPGLRSLLAKVPPAVPIFSVRQDIMQAIAGFPMHRGILALGRIADAPSPAALLAGLPERALILVLFGIANHDNMGGIFRNAAAFGAHAIMLDGASVDPLYRKAIRVSVGASLIVPFARLASDDDPLDLLAAHRFEAIALSPTGGAALSGVARPTRTAVLLGAEGRGLSPELLARARSVRIPMTAGFDSLNVATASGIALYHLTGRDAGVTKGRRRLSGTGPRPPA
jgi:tRNA G18 (ribose-2'-O)-methylase SpoU